MKLKELALSAIAHLGIASQASSTPSGFSDDASERIQDAVCATMPEFHECTTPGLFVQKEKNHDSSEVENMIVDYNNQVIGILQGIQDNPSHVGETQQERKETLKSLSQILDSGCALREKILPLDIDPALKEQISYSYFQAYYIFTKIAGKVLDNPKGASESIPALKTLSLLEFIDHKPATYKVMAMGNIDLRILEEIIEKKIRLASNVFMKDLLQKGENDPSYNLHRIHVLEYQLHNLRYALSQLLGSNCSNNHKEHKNTIMQLIGNIDAALEYYTQDGIKI